MSVSVRLSPIGNGQQFFDTKGNMLAAGTLSTYIAGTTTPYATYNGADGNTANATILTLDSHGRPQANIWLQSGVSYKFVIADSNGVVLATYDNIIGINDVQNGSSIPTGSVMIFKQASAPSGWTRISTFDDAAIRVVGLAPPSSGGSVGFSSALVAASAVDSHTLTQAEMPTHTHDMAFNISNAATTSQVCLFQENPLFSNPITLGLNGTGGGGGHNHTFTLGLKYVDMILCSKD